MGGNPGKGDGARQAPREVIGHHGAPDKRNVEEIRLALDFTATIFARSGAANPRDALDENKPRAPASRPG
jgi:hypothetical protein